MEGKEVQQDIKEKKKSKIRMLLVIAFILLCLIVSYVSIRSSYLEFKELGQNYEQVFYTNLSYRFVTVGICFVALYVIMYFTNRGIKRSLNEFFVKEKVKMPKLPNKSISLVFATIFSAIIGTALMEKIILYVGNTSFGITDPIFNMDIAYYMFQKPLIEMLIMYFLVLMILLTIYTIIYHIIVFNFYFDGIEGKMIKNSYGLKKILRNIKFIAIGLAGITILNIQNMLFEKMITIEGGTEIVGAGYTESTVKLWGYVIFAVIIVIAVFRGTYNFKIGNKKRLIKDIIVIPSYLAFLFIVMVGFDAIFVNSNKLDKEKDYLQYNINNTKQAYNINIEEKNLENSGTITEEQVENNHNVIDNVAIVGTDVMLKSLKDSQTQTGHYTYRNPNIASYNIEGNDKIVYVAPREVANKEKTYNNKTYEYTHSQGVIIASASETTDAGAVSYIQKDVTGEDEKIKISEPRMYFGLESYDMVATNVEGKQEYDYTDKQGNEVTTSYSGQAGLNLGFLDKLVIGIANGNFNLAFSGDITSQSKILLNRNVIERAKKTLPYLIYDENPYTVIDKEGRIIWVIDAYTTSSSYPYSQYTNVQTNNKKERINYIRNSIKVLVDSYSGEISYYITDRTDPIAMAYDKIYPTLFKSKDETIPEDISKHFVYPKYLYDVQAGILEIYHNVKPDVLYRADDVWQIAKFNTSNVAKATGVKMDSYYTMTKTVDRNEAQLGLVQIYNPKDKQNLISYLIGTTNGTDSKLTIYKFTQDSNSAGPMQLAKQIEEDEAISNELNTINVTGTKITKQMIIVPIDNTILYVEPIYQTMLNEDSDVPILKKVIVASGNKVAMGNNIGQALQNLLSQYAVAIEIENTEDIDGVIEALIKANNNLNQSKENGNWEMMGKDIEKIQTLIRTLETVKDIENKKKQSNSVNEINTEVNSKVNNSVNNTNTQVIK